MGRPSSSATLPLTVMRSPRGSPLCWRVKSKALGEATSLGKVGPVISERVTGIEISGCFGARLIEETYGGDRWVGCGSGGGARQPHTGFARRGALSTSLSV